jgi:hypothetical protein
MADYIDLIVDSIKEERCVLMLGPEVALNNRGVPIYSDLPRFFQEETDLEIDKDTDGLIIFKSRRSKSFFYTELKRYYQKYKPIDDIHKKLARIPFHIIISTTPDIILKKCYETFGMNFDFHNYNKKQNPEDIKKIPTGNYPLLYNLLGCITEEDSLIVTHDDLFEFLFSILGEQRLPRELKRCLQKPKVFVFLGFDFERWYLQLLLRLFELHQDAMPIASQAGSKLKEQTKTFYINNFEMEFIDSSIEDLVDDLYKKCESQGLIKEIKESSPDENPFWRKIRELIGDDKIEEAIIELQEHLEGKSDELLNTVIQISGRYYRLNRKQDSGTISNQDADLQMNQIGASLIEIIKELKNL